MISRTLIEGLNSRMVQARLDSLDVRPFLYASLFPVRKVNGFNWKMLNNQLAAKNVAADLHTDNGTIIRKNRPIFQVAQGDIPLFAISRELRRDEIKEYQTALKLADNPDATALVQYWGEDVDFCANGIQSELEYVSLALISNAGKLKFTTQNNATYANEFDLDYQVDSWQKVYTSADWANAQSADVIGDIRTIVKAAKDRNLNPKFIYMNLDEFYKVASSEQVIKACASFASNALGIAQTPDLAQVNAMLAKQAWLNGVQIRVIDQIVSRELQNGSVISGNPFADSRLVITETEKLGSTQYDVLDEQNENIIKAVRAHTVIKKYSTIEPYAEITIGQADAMPVFDTAYKTMFVKTDGTAWQ